MASLTDVYEGHVRTVTTSRRVSLGAGTFVVGTAMVVGSIVVATTAVGAAFGLSVFEAREIAGVLAGLGLPAALLGVFTVLPAGRATRAAALIGAGVSLLGVALFSVAYPHNWFGSNSLLAVASLLVYFAGTITTVGCLFAGLATFKLRNDPGGTAEMELTEEGRVRLVEDTTSTGGFGSVGMFGNDPNGEVSTQTNRQSTTPSGRDADAPDAPNGDDAEVLTDRSGSRSRSRSGSGSRSRSRTGHSGAAASADGGTATVDQGGTHPAQQDRNQADPPADDAEFLDTAAERGQPDSYCGNCAHFEYVKVDEKITPYCGHHDELMEDMDACDQWDARE